MDKIGELSANTKHDTSFETIQRWIEDCCSNHKTCREMQQSGWKPKRLIDIVDYEDGYVRMISSSTLPESAHADRYVALSHCWGRKPFLILERHNEMEFGSGIAVSSLAPNFQDAIYTTHQLGFRYIWIDSLCIVQNCHDDWGEHAPLMNKVYRNAVLTLAAAASPDAYGGFFRDRNPALVKPCPFKLRKEDGALVECSLIKADFWELDVRQAPLSKRAWVVQERLLASRSLYFGQSQIYWECQELHACEVFPGGTPMEFLSDIEYPDAVDAASVKAFRKTMSWLADSTVDKTHADAELDNSRCYQSPYQVWDEVLSLYVECGLTKSEDKLVAISGIVKDFAEYLGDEYLAGLWRKRFIAGLLWHVEADRLMQSFVPATRPDKYRAPTWSWASVDAPHVVSKSETFHGVDEGHAEIIDINVVPKGTDPTAQLSHACLRVTGHLIRTRRRPKRDQNALGSFGRFYPDTDIDAMDGGEPFFCWPIREEDYGKSGKLLMGLVLVIQPETDNRITTCEECDGMRVFSRVGVFESDQGDPLRYLGMTKPNDWEDWGEETDHLWFPEDAPSHEFFVV